MFWGACNCSATISAVFYFAWSGVLVEHLIGLCAVERLIEFCAVGRSVVYPDIRIMQYVHLVVLQVLAS